MSNTYKSQNGNTYKFKNDKHKFVVSGMPGEHTAESAIKNPSVMELLINRGSHSLEEVKETKVKANKQTEVDKTKVDKTKVDKTKADKTKVDEIEVEETEVEETQVEETNNEETKE